MFSWVIWSRGSSTGIAAVTQGDDAVGHLGNLGKPMGDINHPDALVAEIADGGQEPLGFGTGQRAGGFVEDKDPGVLREGLGDFDELLLGDG